MGRYDNCIDLQMERFKQTGALSSMSSVTLALTVINRLEPYMELLELVSHSLHTVHLDMDSLSLPDYPWDLDESRVPESRCRVPLRMNTADHGSMQLQSPLQLPWSFSTPHSRDVQLFTGSP